MRETLKHRRTKLTALKTEPYHSELALFLCSEMVKNLLEECTVEPAVLFKDKINYKKAGGRGFAPHQDAPAYIGFGIVYFITMMIPVDNFTEENGCLELALDACNRGAFAAES